MSGLLILILIFIGIPLLWRWMKPYFFRWMQMRTEDYVRSAMGMPPRDKKGKSRSAGGRRTYSDSGAQSHGSENRGYHSSGPLIPKEYAVDVEFTEIRSYSSDATIASDDKRVKYKIESQVSEAEIIEIKRDK